MQTQGVIAARKVSSKAESGAPGRRAAIWVGGVLLLPLVILVMSFASLIWFLWSLPRRWESAKAPFQRATKELSRTSDEDSMIS